MNVGVASPPDVAHYQSQVEGGQGTWAEWQGKRFGINTRCVVLC